MVRIHSPRPISFGIIELRRLPRVSLFLATPISWKGTLQQYAGRLHRLHDDKRVVEVYDLVDGNVRIYKRHLKSYGDMDYKIVDRAPV